jgi:pre-mRNA-splicing factor CWC26
LDPNEYGTWVEVGGPSSPRQEDTGDLSPPRRSSRADTSLSPPRRQRHDSDNDLSPPRRRPESSAGDGDLSPPRRSRRNDSNDDLSPPRRHLREAPQNEDLSPPRRRPAIKHDTGADLSPPRNRNRHDSPSRSPPRRSSTPADDDGDLSPPRKRAKRHDSPSPPRQSATASAQPVGGLVMAREVVLEAQARKQREAEAMKARDSESMGKGAATVYRDRHGRKLEMLNQMMRQQQGILVDPDEDQMEWGKGKINKVERGDQDRRRREEAGSAYKGYSALTDEGVNQIKLDQDRWGDPLAGLVPKKKAESIRKRPEWTKPFPPNRFNIKPGHLWDGMDRSNGFERQYFERQNTAQARKVEAYHWSAADM